MKYTFPSGRALALILATWLAACGGGGGSGDTSDPLKTGAQDLTALSGAVTFDAVPSHDGALQYTQVSRKPVRGAPVDVMKAGTSAVLASTTTDSNGRYSVDVPAGTEVAVRVWARLVKTTGPSRWEVNVRDNTRGDALYSMQTATFKVDADALERDVHAPSGWSAGRYTATRAAGPFAILDTVYTAMEKVRSVDAAAVFPKLSLFWSPRNTTAQGDTADGEIGTSHFNSREVAIYILGKDDVDTDEYDDSVVAHEWGHYYQFAFSRDDSIAGSHGGFDDLLDRSVAFSEGWGNAWSGIALGRDGYSDSIGEGQSGGFGMRLSDPPTDTRGWFNESSVQYVLWHLDDRLGFQPIHQAMSGALKSSRAITSIHSFAAALGRASPAGAAALQALLASQDISPVVDDAFGAGETNDGTVPQALPLYHVTQAGASLSGVCASYARGSYNKLGNVVYVRVGSLSAGRHVFRVVGPGTADPDFEVYQGALLSSATRTGSDETLSVPKMASGDAVIAIRDYNESASSVCFTIEID